MQIGQVRKQTYNLHQAIVRLCGKSRNLKKQEAASSSTQQQKLNIEHWPMEYVKECGFDDYSVN